MGKTITKLEIVIVNNHKAVPECYVNKSFYATIKHTHYDFMTLVRFEYTKIPVTFIFTQSPHLCTIWQSNAIGMYPLSSLYCH